jgi:hypothetical protein
MACRIGWRRLQDDLIKQNRLKRNSSRLGLAEFAGRGAADLVPPDLVLDQKLMRGELFRRVVLLFSGAFC